jgi:hypothetical protein
MARVEIPIVVLTVDGEGDLIPSNGASVVVQKRSDSSSATVFAAEVGGSTIVQPLTTDTNGRVTGWMDRGAYKAIITIPGGSPYEEDFDIGPSADGGIDTAWIADSAVTANKIASGAVTTLKLADGSVTSAKIVDGTIVTGDLADNSVATAKIIDGAVTTPKVNDGAVTNAKLGDGSVGTTKLGANAVTNAKMAANAVTDTEVSASAAIQGSKLDTLDGRLKQTVGVVNSNNTLTLTTSGQDIPGASLGITPDVAANLLVTASFDFLLDGSPDVNLFAIGILLLDGAAQSGNAFFFANFTGSNLDGLVRGHISQVWLVPLTVAAHTVKLQAAKFATGTGVASCQSARFIYQLVAQ